MSYILRSNLLEALKLAIDDCERRRDGPLKTAFHGGLEIVRDALVRGERVEVVDEPPLRLPAPEAIESKGAGA